MKSLPTIKIKGKEYVMVKDRVAAFREDHPLGGIATEILHLADGVCVIRATATDEDGRVLGTGIAYEKEGSTNINATSYIENCETSAVGRALGFCGYGIDDSLGSANEVANAILQQTEELATNAEKAAFRAMCGKAGVEPQEILRRAGWTGGLMTKAQHGRALAILKEEGLI